MNNPIIYQVVGGLLILFFLYLTYMFTKTWRWLQVTTMFFIFAAVICLTVFTAMSVRTHVAWKSVLVQRRAQLETLTNDRDTLIDGDLTELIHSDPAFHDLSAQLNRVLLDRGRVWRNCTPSPPTPDGQITLQTTGLPLPVADAPEEGAAAEAAPVANRIVPETVLYAFQELEAPPEFGLPAGSKVPVSYLGEFTVTAATDDSATVTPTFPLTRAQIQKIREGAGSWILYETMPADGHQHFSTDPYGQPDWSRPASEVGVYGEMDRALLEQVFQPHLATLGDRAEPLIEQYLRDGMLARETDTPEDQWVKVRFTAAHTEVVDSDTTLDPVKEDFFDLGRATAPLLQRGSEAEFKPNDIAVFFSGGDFVDRLRSEGKIDAETIEPIYSRRLNNYESSFLNHYQQQLRAQRDIRQAERDNRALTESIARVEERTRYRETEAEKLREDLAQFEQELAAITDLLAQMDSLRNEKRLDLSRIYRENLQLLDELAKIESNLTRQLDAATPVNHRGT